MKQEVIINGLCQLGKLMKSIGAEEEWKDFKLGVTEEEYEAFNILIKRQKSYNGWFTESNVRSSIAAIGSWLNEDDLKAWTTNYVFQTVPKE